MKTLIVEDDLMSRLLLQELLNQYGTSHVAVNGAEAIEAVEKAQNEGVPYDLICLDIMLPGVNGNQALQQIRALERAQGVLSTGSKVVMTTALSDIPTVSASFADLCDAYLTKPIHKAKLFAELRRLSLIP